MRKLILPLAAAGTAIAIATPAAAQYYPQQSYAYGAPHYGAQQYGYGYNPNGVQNLAVRVDALQRRIADLQRAHILRGDRAERLRKEARSLQRRIRQTGAYGLAGFAQGDLQAQVARLEQRVNMAASFRGYGGYGYNKGYNGHGYNSGYGAYANPYGEQAYGNRDGDDDGDNDRNYGGRYDRDDDD